jgi:hypothetical protein
MGFLGVNYYWEQLTASLAGLDSQNQLLLYQNWAIKFSLNPFNRNSREASVRLGFKIAVVPVVPVLLGAMARTQLIPRVCFRAIVMLQG